MELQITLDRSQRRPLSIQIAHGIRDAIFAQRLSPGMKLPPSRELARRLQVSRMVVLEAYDWLAAEGYVESRRGSGTYVSQTLSWPQGPVGHIENPPRRTDLPPDTPVVVDFRPGIPALHLFPRKAWRAALARALRDAPPDQLGYGPVEGLPRLRRLIAEYVARTRGLPVRPEQLVITVGAAQAIDLILRTLTPVRAIAIEDPGPEPIRRVIRLHQILTEAIPIDSAGLCVDLLRSGPAAAQVVHVIPSHQYPTGVAMRLDRRLELLAWAERHDAVVVEDDYDSEFRFDQAPPIALAALDSGGRVVYIGSFSKTMFPGLRLGFCVLPECLVDRFLELKWFSDRCVPILEQLALAEWLETGLFERHVRKMRRVYARRRETLVRALEEHFGQRVDVHGVPAGMHVLLSFSLNATESELVAQALQAGVKVYPASPCFAERRPDLTSVIVGFGNLTETAIIEGVARLAGALRPFGL